MNCRRFTLAGLLISLVPLATACNEGEPAMEETIAEASLALSPTPIFDSYLVATGGLDATRFAVATGDVNGDGQVDVMGLANTIRWWSYNGSGFTQMSQTGTVGVDGPHLAAADLDHDAERRLDLIQSGDFWAADVVAYQQNPPGTFTQRWSSDNLNPKWANGLALGDVDDDGWQDVVETSLNGNLVVWWNRGSEGGWQAGQTPFRRSTHTAGGEWVHAGVDQELAVGRFDKVGGVWDSRADVALRDGKVYLSDGRDHAPTSPSWSPLPVNGSGAAGQDVEAVDVDGDLDLDLVYLVNRTAPAYDELRIFANLDGQGFSTTPTVVSLGVNGSKRLLAGHFDRDGGKDFFVTYVDGAGVWKYKLVRRQSSGYQVDSLSLARPASVASNQEPSRLATADINGDGISDIVAGYDQPPNGNEEALVVYMSQALPCTAGAVETVSKSSLGVPTQGAVYEAKMSGNGRFVVFSADGADLVPGDTNGVIDVFVHDRFTGETSRVSVSSQGEQGNGQSINPDISADGQYVTFISNATNLVPGDTNNSYDVFVRDLWNGRTKRISVNTSGGQSSGYVEAPSISADGRYVAFYAGATDLVAGPCGSIYVRDTVAGTTTCANLSYTGGAPNSMDIVPSISASGGYVAFYGLSSNLVLGDTNNKTDAFVRKVKAEETLIVSRSTAGAFGNDYSQYAFISPNANIVMFTSAATNLVTGDTNGFEDVFVRDLLANTTERISVSSAGAQANGASESWQISASYYGQYVAFQSYATNLADGNASSGIYLRNRNGGTTTYVANGGAPSLSHDGSRISFLDGQARVKTLFCDAGNADGFGCQLRTCDETKW